MDDSISRQAAIDAINSHFGFNVEEEYGSAVQEVINGLPSAQPEITRCNDCKHRDKYGCCNYWKGLAMVDVPIATDDNDFCSYAI